MHLLAYDLVDLLGAQDEGRLYHCRVVVYLNWVLLVRALEFGQRFRANPVVLRHIHLQTVLLAGLDKRKPIWLLLVSL